MESSDKRNLIVAASIMASVGVHLCGFLGLGIYVTFKKVTKVVVEELPEVIEPEEETIAVLLPTIPQPILNSQPVHQDEPEAKELAVNKQKMLSPEEFLKVEKKKEELRKKKEPNAVVRVEPIQGFERTTADQESSVAPVDTKLEGARNTLAQSDRAADAGAPERVAVDGTKPRFKHETDIIDRRFKQGDIAHEGGGSSTPLAGDPDSLDVTENLEELLQQMNPLQGDQDNTETRVTDKPKNDGQSEDAQQALAQKERDDSDTLNTSNKIAKNQSQKGSQRQEPKPQGSSAPKSNTAKAVTENTMKTNKGQRADQMKDPFAKAAGMTSEVKKNRVRGSLSRTGKVASRNVKATPLGKYQDSVMRSVEKEWRKRLSARPEFGIPGQLTMHFFVNKDGRVLDLKVLDEHVGSQSQKGITLKAIRAAAIPSMPRALRNSQQGQPVEVEIHFSFN